MGRYAIALLGLMGIQPLAHAIAVPHLNHLQKHAQFKRELFTEVELTTTTVLVTVTDDGSLPTDTTVAAAPTTTTSTTSSAAGGVFNALEGAATTTSSSLAVSLSANVDLSIGLPTSTTLQYTAPDSTTQASITALPTSATTTTNGSGGGGGANTVTDTAQLADYSADTHYLCDGGDNTITFTAADSVTRTINFHANAGYGLVTPTPVVVGPGDVKEVSVDCGWSGSWWAESDQNYGCSTWMLGEASFQAWKYITYYDVSAVDNLTDNTGVHWVYPTDGSADLSGCENFTNPDDCTDYYKFPTDDANGTNGQAPTSISNVFKVGLTCILGTGNVKGPNSK